MERDFESQRSKHSSNQKNKNKKPKPVLPPIDKKVYSLNHKSRGKAIIFNHYQFQNFDYEERKGSELDENRLREELEELGFEVELQSDRTFKGLKRRLREVIREDHTDADCLIVVVMSHGTIHNPHKHPIRNFTADGFYSTSSLLAFDDPYDEEEIFKPFQGDRCPSLAGKPKIFFIQACRGPKKQDIVWVEDSIDDRSYGLEGIIPEGWEQSGNTIKKENAYALPTTADFLIARATFEGTKSLRDTKKGSPFIQILCDELRDNRKRKRPLDLEVLLTNVKRKVALTYEQMPTTYSTLIRRLYLTPKSIAHHVPPPKLYLPADETRTSMNMSIRERHSRRVWDGEEWVDESELEF